MGKIKKSTLKWSFVKYIILCIFLSILGILIIGHGTNYLQDWYCIYHSNAMNEELKDADIDFYNYRLVEVKIIKYKRTFTYWLISNAQVLLMPLWALFCVGFTGMIFYNRELKKPIEKLMDASRKISENQLDFKIEYEKQNELGQLCTAFDNMRQALYENNREMWHSLEERKRLNSAFSHDLRTPLTVLKGYNDFLTKYSGQLTEEKTTEILVKMNSQIVRLENYTYKMSAVQKLEDITPNFAEILTSELKDNFSGNGEYICKNKKFLLNFVSEKDLISADIELVMEVYDNILANAERYADTQITADISVTENFLKIEIYDDGCGFSDKALKFAKEPFYREDKEQNSSHFGLGLYICKIICEKCGGNLNISNTENGGKVSAKFFCKNR